MFYHRMDPPCRIVNLPLSITILTNVTPRLMVSYKSGKVSGNYLNAIPANISLEIFLLHPEVLRWPSRSQGWLGGLGRDSSLHSHNSWLLESFMVQGCRFSPSNHPSWFHLTTTMFMHSAYISNFVSCATTMEPFTIFHELFPNSGA